MALLQEEGAIPVTPHYMGKEKGRTVFNVLPSCKRL